MAFKKLRLGSCLLLIAFAARDGLGAVEVNLIEPPKAALFEAGVFLGGAYLPDYPGSNQSHAHFLPLPYFLYRGTVIRADDHDGFRARLALAGRLSLELSFAGSLPVDSQDNTARQGMPDLDWMGEVGPRLTVLLTDPLAPTRLKLFLPARSVWSTNFQRVIYRGYTLSPGLLLESFDFIRPHWRGLALLSATFANRQLNGYLYDVAPEFARSDRAAYNARAGYVGTDLSVGLMVPFKDRFRFFAGTQLSYHDGSANTDSPLFRNRAGIGLFIGVAFTFFQSHQLGQD